MQLTTLHRKPIIGTVESWVEGAILPSVEEVNPPSALLGIGSKWTKSDWALGWARQSRVRIPPPSLSSYLTFGPLPDLLWASYPLPSVPWSNNTYLDAVVRVSHNAKSGEEDKIWKWTELWKVVRDTHLLDPSWLWQRKFKVMAYQSGRKIPQMLAPKWDAV